MHPSGLRPWRPRRRRGRRRTQSHHGEFRFETSGESRGQGTLSSVGGRARVLFADAKGREQGIEHALVVDLARD